jgi:cytidylate kinase
MNILIGGLTGSGKTTFSMLLSNDLGITFISGSETRSQFINGKIPIETRKYWLLSAEAAELDRDRLDDSRIDIASDKYLQNLVITRSNQIFDVWFLPWLVSENSLKIWLECSLEIRAQRIYKSLGLSTINAEHVYQKILEKDTRAQQFAYKTYGIDIFKDRSPFDVIISTGSEFSIDLIRSLLRMIAENYFEYSRRNQGVNSSRSGKFTSIIYRCPPELYPS